MYHQLAVKNTFIAPPGPRVFAISSGKGGVGKTSFTANLALALQSQGYQVLIFDADLGLANIDVLFGLTPKATISDVLNGKCRLKDIIIEGPKGVKILPASSGIVRLTHLTEAEKLQLLEEFEDLEIGIDIVLLDTAAGISENVLYFNLAAQERLLLVTPEPTSITDVYALIKVLYSRYGLKTFHLVVNCVHHESQGKKVFRQLVNVLERFVGSISLNLIGILPFDLAVSKAIRAQQPLLELFPEAKISKAIHKIAWSLINLNRNPLDGGLKFFGRKIMGVVA